MDPVEAVLRATGIERLNPVQEKALKTGLGKNLIVAAPTASGKTLIAEIAALKTVREGKKVVYIVPLRALASEKYEEFRKKYEPLGMKVAISVGDLDASDAWLASHDIIIVTSEKLDSLLRHGIPWLHAIGLVVADEIHLLTDPTRGPTLEIVLTRLKEVNPLILGLSATISNYKDLAAWLGAEAVWSDYRPVQLYKGICFENEAVFVPTRRYEVSSENVLEELTAIKKQSLIFISTRKGTEATAEKLAERTMRTLSAQEKTELESMAAKILSSLEHKTAQCERLARCVRHGTAFHHAGLTNKQRGLVESGFKSGLIRLICATPTLAAGLNLPAYRVIIRDLKRFSSFRGMDYLPVLEIEQMAGRAGRPAYDTEGEAILLPKNKAEAKYSWDHYINGKPENISSKLGVEPVLRTHVLALIASDVVTSEKELAEFFERTFYAHQYKDMSQLRFHLDRVLHLLEQCHFITTGDKGRSDSAFRSAASLQSAGRLQPTRLGRRVSELYIDPLTADALIRQLGRLSPSAPLLTVLQVTASCQEMRPLPGLRKKDMEAITAVMAESGSRLLIQPPKEWELDYEDFLRSMKLALLLEAWCEEQGEDVLLEEFGVTPGELRVRLDNTDWLLYAMQELGLLLGLKETLQTIRRSRLRMKYGIREELLPLIRLRNVGRVRARRLFTHGLKTLESLRKIPLESLEKIVGRAAAESIKEQLGEEKQETQQRLSDGTDGW